MPFFTSQRRRPIAILLGALVLLAIVLGFGHRLVSVGMAMSRSREGFSNVAASDSRVRFEPGAAKVANIAAPTVQTAIDRVESVHGRPFKRDVEIFVCSNLDSFQRFTTHRGPSAVAIYGRVFFSPRLEESTERIPGLLIHELSHIHLEQHLGSWDYMTHIPSWFREGLAVHVSNGAGAERVSEEAALQEMQEGERIVLMPSGSLISTDPRGNQDMAIHMYYRQAGMLVSHLASAHPQEFSAFLEAILDSEFFDESFQQHFQMTMSQAMEELLGS